MNPDTSLLKSRLLWLLGVTGITASIIWTVATQEWLYWLVSYVYIRMLGLITDNVGLHRYFAHRSFQTGPKRHKFLAWITVLAGVGSPFNWSIHHRHHHKNSDGALDLHSPHENALHTIFGTWVLHDHEWWSKTKQVKHLPRDLLKDPTIRFISTHYYKLWAGLVASALLLGGIKFCVFFVFAPIGWNLVQAAFLNYFGHKHVAGSYRNYETDDHTQNNPYLNLFLLGEGLHNNHHAHPGRSNNKEKPGEIDPAGWIIDKFFKVN